MINDYDIYNERMRIGIEDKVFFRKFIDLSKIDVIVDFGCADGQLIQFLIDNNDHDGLVFIGYDTDEHQIALAKTFLSDHIKSGKVVITDSWNVVEKKIIGKTRLLNLSSVLHEVGSYLNEKQQKKVFDDIMLTSFDYVTIRDMLVSDDLAFRNERFEQFEKDICLSDDTLKMQLKDFKASNKISGTLTKMSDIVHFLLKIDYHENWDREVAENYFYFKLKDILRIFSKEYSLRYLYSYTPNFIQKKFEKYHVNTNIRTHAKIIFSL